MSSSAGPGSERLTIAVLTFRRPREIEALVPLLVQQAVSVRDLAVDAEVLVVDNDPEASAAAGISAAAARHADHVVVRYEHEPTPGISAARNRALDAAGACDLLAFIDDDERPSPQWLRLLVQTYREHRCAAVLGPVVAEYAEPPDPWILAGGFFVRARQATGTTRQVGFTGNLLLDLRVVRRLGLRFDREFGLSGGEDSLFTALLTRAGERILWCDEATVTDIVPAARVNRRWVLTRRFRDGSSSSRVALRLCGGGAPARTWLRVRLTGRGLVRVGGGSARYVLGLAAHSPRHQARGLRTAARGVGTVAGAWGYLHNEYARPVQLSAP